MNHRGAEDTEIDKEEKGLVADRTPFFAAHFGILSAFLRLLCVRCVSVVQIVSRSKRGRLAP
jgi:hypothetical protein